MNPLLSGCVSICATEMPKRIDSRHLLRGTAGSLAYGSRPDESV